MTPCETTCASPRIRGEARFRLSGPRAFTRVFERGKRREGRFLQLVFTQAEFPETGRVGIIVSRKAMPRAVDRNRFKRKVRVHLGALRETLVRYDVILRVKGKLARTQIDPAAMEAEMLLLWLTAKQSLDQAK